MRSLRVYNRNIEQKNPMPEIEIIQIRPPSRPGAAALDDVVLYFSQLLSENKVSWTHSINTVSSKNTRKILVGGHLLNEFNFLSGDDIVLNTEPLLEDKFRANTAFHNLITSGQSPWIADYSLRNLSLVSGEKKYWVCFPALRSYSLDGLHDKKDIDFLFFGTVSNSRLEKIRKLEKYGFTASIISGLFGSDRDAAIRRAMYSINVHFFESKLFETVRCVASMRLGIPVISEPVVSSEVPKPFRESIFFWDFESGEAPALERETLLSQRGKLIENYLNTSDSPEYKVQVEFFAR